MLFTTSGLVADGFYISGLSTYPVHLVDGPEPVLFDGGVACAGKIYAEAIRSVVGRKQPRILFLTHVHWDHCGAVSYLKEAFPSLEIAASKRAREILERKRARELIDRLNAAARPILASLPEVDPSRLVDTDFRPFHIDRELKDGDEVDLGGGLVVQALASPGHTRDLTSYYLPGKRILIAGEASGCLDAAGNIVTEFLADYDVYVSSLARLAALPAEILCQGHRIVFVGRDEVRTFFERSIAAASRFRTRVEELLQSEAGDVDRVVKRIKAEQYDTNEGIKQPEVPYLLNLKAQVTHLAERMKRR